jgi:hypothetical protein
MNTMLYRAVATYVAHDGCQFDRDYYVKRHLALARQVTASVLRRHVFQVDWSVAQLSPSGAVVSPCRLHVLIDSEEEFDEFKRFLTDGRASPLVEDVSRYTDCEIVWDFSVCELA